MICDQLADHWFMCQMLRRSSNPAMQAHAEHYFAAKHTTLLSSDLETKAVSFVNDDYYSASLQRNL